MKKFKFLVVAFILSILTNILLKVEVHYADYLMQTTDKSTIQCYSGTVVDFVWERSGEDGYVNIYIIELDDGRRVRINVGGATRSEVGLYVGDITDVYTKDNKSWHFSEYSAITDTWLSVTLFICCCLCCTMSIVFFILFICNLKKTR